VILRLKKKNSEKANNVKNNCSFRSDCWKINYLLQLFFSHLFLRKDPDNKVNHARVHTERAGMHFWN
jgi:hypothetical protein